MRWFRCTPLASARWVAIDCETSGPHAARARLLSVGAVAVHGDRVAAGESFGALVRQARASEPENILIHGIGGDAQRQGRPLEEVVDGLDRFLADGIPVAFHAGFDAEVLRRHGLRRQRRQLRWIDLAGLAPALFPAQAKRENTLDHWLGIFDIPPDGRHDALGDAFAAAQLLLVVLTEAKRQRVDTVEGLLQTERAGRWLARH